MNKFNTAKIYRLSDFIKETAMMIFLIATIYAVALFWFPEKATTFSLIVPGLLLLKDFYSKASKQRLQQLTFDTDRKEIIILCKSLLSDIKQINLSFDKARLEVFEEKSRFNLFEPLTLYFLKEKMEVFEITKSKDKLPTEILREIILTARQHAIPIND